MLDKKDLQAVGALLDKKLQENNKTLRDEIKENNESLKDEIVAEIGGAVSDGFTAMEANLNTLKKDVDILKVEISKRPTKKEMFEWADKRIGDLELRADRHDYLHINELDKLPSQLEISKSLVKRGFKQKVLK